MGELYPRLPLLQMCGNRTGAWTGPHPCVCAKLRLRLKASRPKPLPPRLDISKLNNDGIRTRFQPELRNRFTGLEANQQAAGSIADEWTFLKVNHREASLNLLGKQTRRSNDWISDHTIALADQAKAARNAGTQNFRALRHQTARSARANRNEYWAQ